MYAVQPVKNNRLKKDTEECKKGGNSGTGVKAVSHGCT